jgi:MGT family glycosyltransferase
MPFALLTALPFVGHLNPLLRQAEELQRRGWRVSVAATREMRDHIAAEAPSIPFVDLGPLGPLAADLRQAEADACADADYRRGGLRFVPVLARIWPVMYDGLIAAISSERPDVMVVDIFTWAGMAAAEKTGVPVVFNNPSLLTGVPLELMPPAPDVPFPTSGMSQHELRWWHKALEPLIRYAFMAGVAATIGRQATALRRSRGLPKVAMHEPLRTAPILVNGAFGLEYQRALPPNVEMVGPMLPDDVPPLSADLAALVSGGPPVIYVNFGTVSVTRPEQLAAVAGALAIPDTRAIWVLKPAQAALLPSPLPASLTVMNWIPSPRALLAHPNVRVFVSHCGINSVQESLAAGTPIVGIPVLADQRDMATRLADAGVGLWLEKTRVTAAALQHAIRRVMDESSFRERIPAVQTAFTRAGGVRRAADLIEAAVARSGQLPQ